jgi:hypothetical protein
VQVVDIVPTDFAVTANRIYVLVSDTVAKNSTISYAATDAIAGAALTPFSTISNEQCNAMSADDATGDLFLSCVDATSGNQYIRHILGTTGGAGARLTQVMVNGSGTVKPWPMTGKVYWWEFAGGSILNGIRRMNFDGTAVGTLQSFASTDMVWSMLGIDSTSAFIWQSVSGVESLRQVSLTDGSTITLYNNGFAQAGFASDGTTAFWWTGGGGVYSVPKGTTTANMNTVFADQTLATMGPIDGTSVYYGTDVDAVSGATGCTSYRVARRPKGGGSETALVDGIDNCVGPMKGDANVVAWTIRGRGCGTMTCTRPLLKVAK